MSEDGGVGLVVSIVRYPLKSAAGEVMHAVDVDEGGLRGDRCWACLDQMDGTVGSAKHPRRWGRLLQVSARLAEGGCATRCILTVAGRQLVAGSQEADDALTRYLGRAVRLSQAVPPEARLHRELPAESGLLPDWMAGLAPGSELITDVVGARPGGRFLDYGPVHLVTTGALARLAAQLHRPAVEASRFRPNLVLDLPQDPEPGAQLCLGDTVLAVSLPTPRCIVPGLSGEPKEAIDGPLLGTLARSYRTDVGDLGRAACFGVYADVLRPGRVEVGQRIR